MDIKTVSSYIRLVQNIKTIQKEIAFKVLLCLAVSATFIIQAFSMAAAVTAVFDQAVTGWRIPLCVLVALIAVVVRALLSRWIDVYSKMMAARVKTEIRLLIFDKILHLGPGYLTNKRSGKIQSLVLDGIESLEPFLVNYLPQLLAVIITGVAIGGYLCTLDVLTGVLIIVISVLCVILPCFTLPVMSHSYQSYWGGYALLNAQYVDAIQGMTTLKAFNAEKAKGEELTKNAWKFYTRQLRNTSLSLIDSGIIIFLTSMAASFTVAVVVLRSDLHLAGVSVIPIFLFLAAECARPMFELNNAWHSSLLGLSVASDLFQIVDEELRIQEIENPDSSSLDKEKYPDIRLEGVTFRYRSDDKAALEDVTLTIPSGAKVAVVGKSGAGKSTLINLLLRFYDVSAGAVYLNGVNIKDYSLEYLRSKIGVVFQDFWIFQGTVRENLKMATPDASDKEMIAAAKAANLHDRIMEMDKGYDTMIGERGSDLSGGERQRLAIARSIMKDATILILDEATSSVDANNERLIQEAVTNLAQNRTTLIIAHRLSTVQNADIIFVLDEGHLAETGTHEQLIAKNGVYAHLVSAQMHQTEVM